MTRRSLTTIAIPVLLAGTTLDCACRDLGDLFATDGLSGTGWGDTSGFGEPSMTTAGDDDDDDDDADDDDDDDDGADDDDDADDDDGDDDDKGDDDDVGDDDDGEPEPYCGNGIHEAGEECDDGVLNADTAACTLTCELNECGDGLVGPGEDCDDGNLIDIDACTNGCKIPVCGDAIVDPAEECDDGDLDDSDACTTLCTLAYCGDSFVQLGEQCDEGDLNGDQMVCTAACRDAYCGDALVHAGVEACDDGNSDDSDGCTTDCRIPSCGDGVVDGLEECDDGNADNSDACTTSCTLARCGDAMLQGGEECDNGDLNDDTAVCTSECLDAICGDGLVFAADEDCDDQNSSDTDACLNTCEFASCGDGLVHIGVEECDDGDADDTNACVSTCEDAFCGDGYVHTEVEDCDDGNAVDSDGCNVDCVVSGSQLWTTVRNGEDSLRDYVASVALDPDGNVFVAGRTVDAGLENIWVAKLSPTGQMAWERVVNSGYNDNAFGVVSDSAGNILVAGELRTPDIGANIWVRKYSPTGNVIWTSTLDGPGSSTDRANAIAVDSNDDVVVTGQTWTSGNGTDIWVRKYEADGVPLWTDDVNGAGSSHDVGHGIVVAANDDVIVAGSMWVAGESTDVWLRRYNGAGEEQWTTTFSGADHSTDEAYGVTMDADGDIFVVGRTWVTVGSHEIWLRKYDGAGTPVWTVTHGGDDLSSDSGYGVAIDPRNGDVVVAGEVWALNQGTNMWIARYDTDATGGVPLWSQDIASATPENDFAKGIAVTANGSVIVGGQYWSGTTLGDAWVRATAP